MKGKKTIFRHEIKYLINACDEELIRQKLKAILKLDEHTVDRKYKVRSLYFDDYWDVSYLDKTNGFSGRKKYRIRTYDDNPDIIKLECKRKQGSYISKTVAALTLEEYQKIIDGDYGFLLNRPEELCKQFYYECTGRFVRPRVFVEYEREPYVMEAGDVRITFDKNVRAASPWFSMFDDSAPYYHALEPGKLVLEVKFTEFLPEIVKNALSAKGAEMCAISKYTMCCKQINYLTAKLY